MYPQKTRKTQACCTIVFKLPPLQEYTFTLCTPRTRLSVFLNTQMNAWNFSRDRFNASSFNALCTYIKPISMLGSSVTMIGAGPGPYHTYSPIIISWNKMEKVLHLTRKQWVSQSYCKKSNQLVIVSFLLFLSFFFFFEENKLLPWFTVFTRGLNSSPKKPLS